MKYGIIRETLQSSVEDQKREIEKHHSIPADQWITVDQILTRSEKNKLAATILRKIGDDSELVMCDLTVVGDSLGQSLLVIYEIVERNIAVQFIDTGVVIDPQNPVAMQMIKMLTVTENRFIDLANIKRRQSVKKSGREPGRKKGLGKSVLDPHINEIEQYLEKGVTIASIAKIYGLSWTAANNFIKTRGL